MALRVSNPFLLLQHRHKACGPMREGRPQQHCHFKMQPRQPCPERGHLSLSHQDPCIFSFPPLVESCLSSVTNLYQSFSPGWAGGMSVFNVINTIVNGTVKAELPDSAHQVTGILCTTEKFPVLFYINPL